MLHEVRSAKPPSEVIAEAAQFFARRRVKVVQRSRSSLRFVLPGGDVSEAGTVRAVREPSAGQTRVTVDTGGLSVWHVAESYVRDLRKQWRSSGRARRGRQASGSLRLTAATLGSLGEALGMQGLRPPASRPPAAVEPAAEGAIPVESEPVAPEDLTDLVAPPPADLVAPVPADGDDQPPPSADR